MSTQPVSPESHADALRDALREGGPDAVVRYIDALEENARLGVYSYAQRLFSGRGAAAASLDEYLAIARAGIAEATRQSGASTDPEQSARLKDTANVFSFNLLADLAECWPDDRRPRERRHFEEGLRAADDCIRWREELAKPPGRQAMAWWGRGMHLLSLDQDQDAVEAFRRACELVFGGADFTVSSQSTDDQLLYAGYHVIARIAIGDAGAEEDLARVRRAFEAQLADEATREDATFGLDQLGIVEGRIRARADA